MIGGSGTPRALDLVLVNDAAAAENAWQRCRDLIISSFALFLFASPAVLTPALLLRPVDPASPCASWAQHLHGSRGPSTPSRPVDPLCCPAANQELSGGVRGVSPRPNKKNRRILLTREAGTPCARGRGLLLTPYSLERRIPHTREADTPCSRGGPTSTPPEDLYRPPPARLTSCRGPPDTPLLLKSLPPEI